MLAAVLNGKRRGTGLAGKQLVLGELDGAEDVLTASVFERVAYLPDAVFESFLDVLLALDEPVGALESLTFWPSWSLAGQRIEPDVVLQWTTRVLLVEAKRYDDGLQQYAAQLARELQAGWEEGVLGDSPVLLTIGGMLDYSEASASDLRDQIDAALGRGFADYELVCRSWHQVFQALQLAIANADHDGMAGLQRLADDIADVYEWHGLRTHAHRWLADLKAADIAVTEFPMSLHRTETAVDAVHLTRLAKPLSDLQARDITSVAFPISTWSFR